MVSGLAPGKSISFLYYFLPLILVLYYAVPKPLKNFVLLLSSLLFYFYGEPVYSLLMLFSIISGYLHGLWISRARGTMYARIPLVSSIVIGLSSLLFFKYADFFITNINAVFGADFTLLKIALPLGISFYTFQVLSYTIDVYRGEVGVQHNPLHFGTYVSLFPQLIAGPIVRYATVDLMLEGYAKITLVDIRYISPELLEEHIDFSQAHDILFLYSTQILNNSMILR